MLDETLTKLETKIRQASTITTDHKTELLQLLSTLKAEMAALATTHAEHAASITGFTEVSMHEATRQARNPHLVDLAVQGLQSSVAELEVSHPRLVEMVNTLSVLLSNIGV
jgi:hypothetical protein